MIFFRLIFFVVFFHLYLPSWSEAKNFMHFGSMYQHQSDYLLKASNIELVDGNFKDYFSCTALFDGAKIYIENDVIDNNSKNWNLKSGNFSFNISDIFQADGKLFAEGSLYDGRARGGLTRIIVLHEWECAYFVDWKAGPIIWLNKKYGDFNESK